MGPIQNLQRLNPLASAARLRLRVLAGDDRALAGAAIATTILAAWRLSVVMAASAAAPASPAPAPATAAAALAPRPRGDLQHQAQIVAGTATSPVRAEMEPHRGAPPGDPQTPPAHTTDEIERAVQRLLATEDRRVEFEDALGRMGSYAPLIRATLRDRGVPQDLLYLAMIESAYKPGAVSRAGATGMWQFMKGTAALYGLEVSAYVDERRDPVRSTRAAVRHLDDLHREFGSWHLALAAYNAGPPRVQRALRQHARGKPGDERLYWQIRSHLPSETRAYVPLFLAAVEIARHPTEYGLSPRPKPPLAFREVWYPGGSSLAQIARTRGLPVDHVLALNAHLVRGITPPGRAWPVRLPLTPTSSPSAQIE